MLVLGESFASVQECFGVGSYFFRKSGVPSMNGRRELFFFLEKVSFIRILSSNRRLNLVRLPACTSKQIYFLVTFVRKEKSGFDREGME